MAQGDVVINILENDEASAALARVEAKIKAITAAQDENVRRFGAYSGGIFNTKQLTAAAGEYQNVLEKLATVGSFRLATSGIIDMSAAIERATRAQGGLLNQFGQRITSQTYARDFVGPAAGFEARVATGAAVSRAENIAQERAYRQEVAATVASLKAYRAEQEKINALGRQVAPRESIAAHDAEVSRQRLENDRRLQVQIRDSRRVAAEDARANAVREMEAFNAQIQMMGGRTSSPIHFEGAGRSLRAVQGEMKNTTAAGSVLSKQMGHLSADFDEVASGRKRQLIATIGASLRDAGLGGGQLALALGGLVTIIGALELAGLVTRFGDVALKTRIAAQAAGMSIGQFSLLQRTMQLVDGDADKLSRVFGILSEKIEQGIADPLSAARGAFDTMNISIAQLTQGLQDPMSIIDLLRQRWQAMGDTFQRTQIFHQLLGRQFEELVPYLELTQGELYGLSEAARQSGSVLGGEAARQFEQAAIKAHILGENLTGLGMSLASLAGQSGFIEWLTKVVAGLRGAVDAAKDFITESKKMEYYGPPDIWPQVPGGEPGAAPGKWQRGPAAAWGRFAGAQSGQAAVGPTGVPSVQEAMEFAQSQLGYNRVQSAILVGQMQQESSLNPLSGLGTAHQGMGQWDTTRFQSLKDFASTIGADWQNWQTQMRFARAEIEKMVPGFAKIKDDQSELGRGADMLTRQWEKPGNTVAEVAKRTQLAQQAIQAPQISRTALGATGIDSQKLQEELNKNVAIIHEQTSQREAEFNKQIAQADKNSTTTNAIEAQKNAFMAAQVQKEIDLRREYAQKVAGTDPQLASMFMDTRNLLTQQTNLQTQAIEKAHALRDSDYQEYSSNERQKLQAAEGSTTKTLAVWQEWLAHTREIYTAGSKEYENVLREMERSTQESARKMAQTLLEQTKEGIAQSATIAQIQRDINVIRGPAIPVLGVTAGTGISGMTAGEQQRQKIVEATQEAAKIWVAAMNYIQSRAKDMAPPGTPLDQQTTVQMEAARDVAVAFQDALQHVRRAFDETAQVAEQSARKLEQSFIELFNRFGSALQGFQNSLFQALLFPQIDLIKAGLTSIPYSERMNEIALAFQAAMVKAISDVGDFAETLLSKAIGGALSGVAGTTISEFLDAKVAGWFGQTIGSDALTATTLATVMSTSVTAPIVAAITGASAAQAGTNIFGAGVGGAANAAGIGGFFSMLFGGPGPLTFIERGGVMPSAAGGMLVGGRLGFPTMLHSEEMVLPRDLSLGMQGMIRGGQFNRDGDRNATLNYSPTINTGRGGGISRAEFAAMLSSQATMFVGEARNMIRSGWRP